MYSVVHRQDGTIIVTVALVMLFLLGFMGIALDFGRLFIVKTELQTAMDSCALAAAHELDGTITTFDRPISAGRTAGNLNRVNLQSATWSGQGTIVDADITFRDAAYLPTGIPAAARYAQCQHTQPNIQMWLLQSMGAFSGPAPAYANTQTVMASAVATRASAQSTSCSILPLGLRPKAGGTAPNYGFVAGEWVTLLHQQNAAQGGEIGWANLDGSNSASRTEFEVNHRDCSITVEPDDQLGTPGVQASIADAWNARFGIYKNNSGPPAQNGPDYTGYSYTSTNWPSQQNAYGDFVARRAAFAPCHPSGNATGRNNSCESATGLDLNSFQYLATPAQHAQYGSNRRIATVPVLNASSNIIDYACMLMLQPMSIPMAVDVKLEFLGNAADFASPCRTTGLPGGSLGPLIPVLVR